MNKSVDKRRGVSLYPAFPFSLIPVLAALLLLLPGTAGAQTASAPHIKQFRVGLPSEPGTGLSRNGAWAPIYVTLEAGADGNSQGAFRLVAGTTDGQEMSYHYGVSVPALAAGEERVAIAYLRPGNDGSEFTVSLQAADGRLVQTIPHSGRESDREIAQPRDVLYLALGSPLPGLKRALLPKPDDAQANAGDNVPYAAIENVSLLPDRWFGYDAADVVVLATSSESFLDQLLNDSSRSSALLEWVRRGGRLVISVGHNHQRVAQLLQKMPLLDCPIKGVVTRASLPAAREWANREVRQPLGQIEVARVIPGPAVRVLLRERIEAGDLDDRPILVQGSCGLGQVLLVAFDLDRAPFPTWEGQAAFWKRLTSELNPTLPERKNDQEPNSEIINRELGAELERTLETFADLPVISFGWIALFIFIYILLIGPLDYFVLKRLFKRLELTWITFPLIVIAVSAAAYFTAYHLKGDDLHVNKVDLIEIDLHGPRQVYGRSWFALFSPRPQNFTIGIEPAAAGWSPAGSDPANASPLVAVMANPERGRNKGAQSLFRHPYQYEEDAAGLENVPIPVWSARTFAASWRLPVGHGVPPVEAALRRSRTSDVLVGTITNHLPVELNRVTLFYQGKWYALGDLVPEETRRVERVFEKDSNARDFSQWFSGPSLSPGGVSLASGQLQGTLLHASHLIKPLLFYQASEARDLLNSGLRGLDQSWRLLPQAKTYRDEAILVARTASISGRAEEITAGTASPTRLWLERLPEKGVQRPAVPGRLTQETYVRVYIPVAKP